jgi:hypothetical protein
VVEEAANQLSGGVQSGDRNAFCIQHPAVRVYMQLDAHHSGSSGINWCCLDGSSPALAQGATQISGVAFLDEADTCDSSSMDAANALIMDGDGDLEGCLYTFVGPADCSPSGTYRETGTELFVGEYNGEVGTFRTTYKFEAKYEDCPNLVGEIFGRCQHPIVEGSGTGVFEGVRGRLDFKDDVETGEFLYRGHLRF